MDLSRTIAEINPSTFDKLVLAYPDVLPDKLSKLDKQRYQNIPETVKNEAGTPSLTKDQLVTLVEWKLSHGKFRPTLRGLVQQNPEQTVLDTTKDGFKAFSGSSDSAKASLNILTKLKGIGPATASLLLSVYDPETAPFFSDELFRWCFFQSGKGKGWDRDIKYNLKEYLQLFEKVQELRRRFQTEHQRDIAAVAIEKVAYVLGKAGGVVTEGVAADTERSSLKRKAPTDQLDKESSTQVPANEPASGRLSKRVNSSQARNRAFRPR